MNPPLWIYDHKLAHWKDPDGKLKRLHHLASAQSGPVTPFFVLQLLAYVPSQHPKEWSGVSNDQHVLGLNLVRPRTYWSSLAPDHSLGCWEGTKG